MHANEEGQKPLRNREKVFMEEKYKQAAITAQGRGIYGRKVQAGSHYGIGRRYLRKKSTSRQPLRHREKVFMEEKHKKAAITAHGEGIYGRKVQEGSHYGPWRRYLFKKSTSIQPLRHREKVFMEEKYTSRQPIRNRGEQVLNYNQRLTLYSIDKQRRTGT